MRSFGSHRTKLLWSVALIAVMVGVMAGVGVAQKGNFNNAADNKTAIEHANSLSHAFRRAAKMTMPAVVKIRTVTRAKQVGNVRGMNPFRGSPFEEFFDDDELRRFFAQPFSTPRRQGMGSGVIIDRQGIILTNNHVVADADEVVVELPDGREFKSTDIKTDPDTDLAVVRISGAGDLPEARLGSSSEMAIGDWVIAIGHPFGLDSTVSAGIISGKGRSLSSGRRSSYLQTDAAINPGNSGGPLVNLEGEVIGINTAIASNSGGYQGVGFAIPIDLAKWVTKQLVQRGSVQRAFLGVKIGKVTAELAEQFGVRPGEGVLIGEVLPDSPASKAGLKEGDLIVSFAGRDVHQPRDLQEIVERSDVGVPQSMEILRNGQKKTLQVVLQAMPKSETASLQEGGSGPASASKGKAFAANALGIEVANLTPEAAERLGFAGYEGVLITSVDPTGPAAEHGLKEGMLIRQVGQTRVSNIEQFEKALKQTSVGDGVLLLVRTADGNQFFVVVKR